MESNEYKYTDKELEFIKEYMDNGYNQTEAYMKVYGLCRESAGSRGYALMKKPKMKALLRDLQKESYEQAGISAERVAMKLAEFAFREEGQEGYGNAQQMKALDLLQKQLGLQTQKVDASVQSTTIQVTVEE